MLPSQVSFHETRFLPQISSPTTVGNVIQKSAGLQAVAISDGVF